MLRPDQEIISDMVPESARVLDLGCGDGGLLSHLMSEKAAHGYGFDLDEKNIEHCLAKGVNAIQRNLNNGLDDLEDSSFDVVIMAETLQVMSRPDLLMKEMLRVGKTCIVTLPNFGHWQCRLQLLSRGLMPISKNLPHQWYETPNIHLCTFQDFQRLCAESDFSILERRVVGSRYRPTLASKLQPNLFGAFGLYRLSTSP